MRYHAYIRVSKIGLRDEASDSFLTVDDQRKRIEGWAASQGHEIVEVFQDIDVSGKDQDRPQFIEMMSRLDEVDGVAVSKIDRFGRSLLGALGSLKELQEQGKGFASVGEGLDPSTLAGRLTLNLLLSLAQFELERVTESWSDVVEHTIVDQGKWLAGAVPFGYSKQSKRLVVNEHEAEYVRGIYKRRSEGSTWPSICDWLNGEGVRTRRGNQWVPNVVRDLVANRSYLGESSKQGYTNPTAHEAVVGLSVWLSAQNILSIEQSSNQGGEGYLLSGLARCSGCSFMASGTSYGRRGEQTKQYACRRKQASGVCNKPASMTAKSLEPIVIEKLFSLTRDVRPKRIVPGTALEEAAVAEAEAQLAVYRDDLTAREILGEASYHSGLRVRVDAVSEALRALSRAVAATDLPTEAGLHTLWKGSSTSVRNKILRGAFDAVFIKRGRGTAQDRVRFILKGESGNLDLPGKGRSRPLRQYKF